MINRSSFITSLCKIEYGRKNVIIFFSFISGLKGRTPSITDLGEIEYGDRVIVAGQRKGTVKYVGESKFAPGKNKMY